MAATVVPDVSTVRGSVSLMLRLRISYKFLRLNLRRFSRTRSNVTMVSFTEYPTMNSNAVATASVTSRLRMETKAIALKIS